LTVHLDIGMMSSWKLNSSLTQCHITPELIRYLTSMWTPSN
jgi:hypothetical protein